MERISHGIVGIGQLGRLVIPVDIRKKLGLVPGVKVEIIHKPKSQEIIIKKVEE